jgi:hypothetical protein
MRPSVHTDGAQRESILVLQTNDDGLSVLRTWFEGHAELFQFCAIHYVSARKNFSEHKSTK